MAPVRRDDAQPPTLRPATPDEPDEPGRTDQFGPPDPATADPALEDPGPWTDAVLLFVVPFALLAWLAVAYCVLALWAGRTSIEGMLTFSALVLLVPTSALTAAGTAVTIVLLHRRGSPRAARAVGWLGLLGLVAVVVSAGLALAL
ncbi:hypothetical protein MRQ36_00615 [Micromonospora sp. R77]|uniref:hypothetical protein n=1 Tax=Micromonospora sp. R77 TaxID=2925836 RepID=UPI001F61619D|nr:hypothetical protein [Micromonospora sp. R77]MCI4061150.1 hypothetical protein [Micromonospora sp. R77]